MGCEEPKDYTLRTVCAEAVQKVLQDRVQTYSQNTDYIDPLVIELKEHLVHCSHVESEPDDLPWYFDL